jgi:GntR family transcriptional regulator
MDLEPTIEFRLDRTSGVPAYRQLVDQVRQALQLGILRPGDQLPTVRDVVRQIAINPITEGRPGSGTFVKRSLDAAPERRVELQRDLATWIREARKGGLDDEGIGALMTEAMRTTESEGPR